MEDLELRQQLDAVRKQVGELRIREAWILLAMGRLDAAFETAEAARRAAAGRTVAAAALRDVLREAVWVRCAVWLGRREWGKARASAEGWIDVLGRDAETDRLSELAGWGQRVLGPPASWRVVRDPARELAAFDPVTYARDHLAALDAAGEEIPATALTTARAPVVPFYQGDRGRLPVDEDALRAELAAVGDESGPWAWAPHIHRAWLLIALGRYEEALGAVDAARHEYYGFRRLSADRSLFEALFEDGCEAELVADMALERWDDAADAGLRGLADHAGRQRNDPLVSLVAVARGSVSIDWDTWRQQLIVFDPAQYALHVFHRPPVGFRERR